MRLALICVMTVVMVAHGWCHSRAAATDDENLPAEVLKEIESGVEYANAGIWLQANFSFDRAYNGLNQAQRGRLPPGYVFNRALVYDHMPGRQLAAAFWYEWFLAVASDATQASDVRRRISILLREFDAMQTAKIDIIHAMFTDMVPLHKERRVIHRHTTNGTIRTILRQEGGAIDEAIRNAAAALIYMGRITPGLELLSEFGLVDQTSDSVMIALMSLGQMDVARPYAKNFVEFEKAKGLIADTADKMAKRCQDDGRSSVISILARNIIGNYGQGTDIESSISRRAVAENHYVDEVYATNYDGITVPMQSVGQARWHYRIFRARCG